MASFNAVNVNTKTIGAILVAGVTKNGEIT
jgi:hypothetical protein